MTGYFVRIRRDDGSMENVEIDQMTDSELDRIAERFADPTLGWKWVVALAKWIRDNVKNEKSETKPEETE